MAITTPGIPIPTTTEEVPQTLERALPEPQLDIRRRVQLEDAWCYAACAAMAIKHVKGESVRQCKIAGFVKGNNCCGTNPLNSCTSSGCRKDQIKPIFTNWSVKSLEVNAQISLNLVRTEIDADRPVEVVIDWDGVDQSSHSILITGIIDEDEMVYVVDPLTGSNNNTGWTTYESLTLGFGYGNWDMTWRKLRL